MNLGSTQWSSTILSCPSITYQIIDTSTNAQADSIFYISSDILYVLTSDKTKVKDYNLELRASIISGSKTYQTVSSFFTVKVTDKCLTATISKLIIPN
jgi:hypothetical protein